MFEKQQQSTHSESQFSSYSWLKERKSNESRPMMDCDFSSIEVNSRFDLMVESRVRGSSLEKEIEEIYGLAEVKRKYESQRKSQLAEAR
jgi:hypothetical protein